ncbi:FecR family protein [Chitinophaga sp. 22321]|uniref:FecR domain-containing protein n=1 Tax=Chitinophaga hostae TaxID=2831022 RepID=A0ABS5J4D0_9BACT|nr:FecR domain-containing protein [Chitinophaga hostae]MBS0030083.1 FecR domain-containing protein [Chitinophaga hostae]
MPLQPNTNELDYTILIKFIDGQASPEETAMVLVWLKASPDNQALYFQVKDIFDQQLAAKITAEDADQSWQQVLKRLPAADQRRLPVKHGSWLKYAAAVLVLLLAGGAYLFTRNDPRPAALVTLVSKKASVQTVLLADSTRIWVKPGGSVKMRDVKEEGEREVWLEGSAYFEVVKKAEKPFMVHVPDMTVTVLGTSFTVNEDKRHTAVMVNTGLIKATAFNRELLLHPGERGMVVDSQIQLDHVNPQLYAAWKDGDYKFEHTSVNEIAELLRANYGYEVEILQPQKFRDTKISGRVLITDEKSLCKALGAMLEAGIRKEGNRIIIQPK